MNKSDTDRYITIIILIILLVSTLFTSSAISKKTSWWDKSYSYRQEIIIPFDTNLELSKYQPIDTHVDFLNNCYAKDENIHSIRVICQKNSEFHELESQIYELEKTKDNQISSCNIVFLIPDIADGTERYFIYYSESEKNGPNYQDHVKIKDSSYRYEFVSGFPMQASFFDIVDDEHSIYQITYKGSFYGDGRSQTVGKLLENSKEVNLQNGDIIATFEFSYYKKDAEGTGDDVSTCDKFISKEILNDGSLMIEVGIKSSTINDEATTTNFYKYYHNPSDNKKIHVKVRHEANKDIETLQKKDILTDGELLSIETGFTKSTAIKELNFGEMLPYLHFHNENDFISEYKVTPNPENFRAICPIDTNDDIDLGTGSWASFDEGKEGKAHAFILESTNVILSGSDEKDGVQVKYYEQDNPHLKGLEFNHAGLLLTRNTYETGEARDYHIPKDFCAEFYVEFFTTETGGYKIIPQEAEIFKELVKIKPSNEKIISTEKNDHGDNTLTIFLHNTMTSSLGFGLSAIAGINLSYDTVELYKNGSMIRTGSPSKLEIRDSDEEYEESGLGKLKSVMPSLDWKNFSFFKKVSFKDLKDGRYIVKIFRNNCKIKTDKKLIGYKIIDVNEDIKTRIFCKPAGLVSVFISDQNNKPIDEVDCRIIVDNHIIIDSKTLEDGKTILSAPILSNDKYVLSLKYNGFIIFEEPLELGLINVLKPDIKEINISRYDLKIKIKDKWNDLFSYDINPILLSENSNQKFTNFEQKEDEYIFKNLYSTDYNIEIAYNNDLISKKVSLNSDKEIKITMPTQYNLIAKFFNNRGEKLENCNIILEKNGKSEIFNSNNKDINLPPGRYDLKILLNDKIIGKTNLELRSDYSISLSTKEEPIYPAIIIILSVILLVIGFYILYKKKRLSEIYILFALALIFISIVLPWWSLNGSSENAFVKSNSNMYLIPSNFVSFTSNNDILIGETSFLPTLFTQAMKITLILIIASTIIFIVKIMIKNRLKKKIRLLLYLLGLICLISSITIFSCTMSEYANLTVGGFIGKGNIDVSIPGEDIYYSVASSWGPGLGYYLIILSIIFVFFGFMINRKEKIKNIIRYKKN